MGWDDDGRELVVHEGSLTVVAPGRVTPTARDHYAVFTPYFRRWRERPLRTPREAPARIAEAADPGRPAAAGTVAVRR